MTQTERIRRHLDTFGSITPAEALQEYGCMRLGARIYDLRRLGIPIEREIVTGKNRFGESTHYARYKKAASSAATPETATR
nr:MAG TPA: helix-turn-helix domain protein [Caudoviricetes sp.]